MELLCYKGIVFDDYEQNDDKTFWAEICEECANKYFDKIKNDIDDGGTAQGCCSVCGCENNGEDLETKHYYIDFTPKYVEFVKEGE